MHEMQLQTGPNATATASIMSDAALVALDTCQHGLFAAVSYCVLQC